MQSLVIVVFSRRFVVLEIELQSLPAHDMFAERIDGTICPVLKLRGNAGTSFPHFFPRENGVPPLLGDLEGKL